MLFKPTRSRGQGRDQRRAVRALDHKREDDEVKSLVGAYDLISESTVSSKCPEFVCDASTAVGVDGEFMIGPGSAASRRSLSTPSRCILCMLHRRGHRPLLPPCTAPARGPLPVHALSYHSDRNALPGRASCTYIQSATRSGGVRPLSICHPESARRPVPVKDPRAMGGVRHEPVVSLWQETSHGKRIV